jgi:hypothetical protein
MSDQAETTQDNVKTTRLSNGIGASFLSEVQDCQIKELLPVQWAFKYEPLSKQLSMEVDINYTNATNTISNTFKSFIDPNSIQDLISWLVVTKSSMYKDPI